nr:lipoyl(octanoyl) transferase LipB [Desulfosarcina sp. BuS5]
MTNLKNKRRCFVLDLPLMEYSEALGLQRRIVSAINDKVIGADILLVLEHHPVFTLGSRGGLENILVLDDFLRKKGIRVIDAERGGDITFHGPGQIVVYPVINLPGSGLRVADFVSGLEEMMIRAAADWGIYAKRDLRNRGAWVGNKKLGSVGIRIRRGTSFHGLALNVNISLEPFKWINPCGIKNIEMTSFKKELSRKISMPGIRKTVMNLFADIFKKDLIKTDLTKLQEMIKCPATA